MYHKQAIDLAHELTNFVVAETEPVIRKEVLEWPGPKDVPGVLKSLLDELFLLDQSSIRKHASLREDLGLDSLDLVELVMNCERELGITLQDQEWICLKTYGEWEALLVTKANPRAKASIK